MARRSIVRANLRALVGEDIHRFGVQFFGRSVDANEVAGVGRVAGKFLKKFANDAFYER